MGHITIPHQQKIMSGENYKRIVGSRDYYITDSGHLFRKVDSYTFKPVPMYENAPGGYIYTNFVLRDGKQWTGTVHGLVAKYFVKKPRWARNLEVAHIDNNKQNNAASNLCWMTHEENMAHGWATGQFKKVAKAVSDKRKSLNGNRSELTDTDVRQIRHLRNEGLTNVQVGFIFDLHPMQISRIFNRRSFANV